MISDEQAYMMLEALKQGVLTKSSAEKFVIELLEELFLRIKKLQVQTRRPE